MKIFSMIMTVDQKQKNIRAGPSEKGAYGFSNIMRANDVDDVIYDVTIGNIQHATQTFL